MKKQNRDKLSGAFTPGRAFTLDQLKDRTGLSRAAISYGLPLIGAERLEGYRPYRYYLGEAPKLRELEPNDPLANLPQVTVGDFPGRAAVEIADGVLAARSGSSTESPAATKRAEKLLRCPGTEWEDRPSDDAARVELITAFAKQARYFASVVVWLQSLGPDWRTVINEALATQKQ